MHYGLLLILFPFYIFCFSKRTSEIDCSDVNKLRVNHQFDDEDEDHYDGKYFHIINNYKQTANQIELNDDDYYFTSKKKFPLEKTKSKKRNGSVNSQSTTAGTSTSSNKTNNSTISKTNKTNAINGTSSSGVSSNTSESGDCVSDSTKAGENLLSVNTIKYNAKTNILHQNVKHNTLQKKRATTSDYQPYEKLSMTMKPSVEKKSQNRLRVNAVSASNLSKQAKTAMAVNEYLQQVYRETKNSNHVNKVEAQLSDNSIEYSYGKKDLDNSFGLSLYVDASEILTQSVLNEAEANKAKSEPSKEEQKRDLVTEVKMNGELLLSCNADSSDLPSTPTDSSMLSNDESVTPPSCYHSDTHTDTRESNAQSSYFSANTTKAISSFKQTRPPGTLLKASSALTVITKAPLTHNDIKFKKLSKQMFAEVPSSSSSGCSSLENQYYSVKSNQLETRSSNEDLSTSNQPNLTSFGIYKSSQIDHNPSQNKIRNIIDSMNKQQTKYANASNAKSVVKSAVFTNENLNFYLKNTSSSSSQNNATQSRIEYV